MLREGCAEGGVCSGGSLQQLSKGRCAWDSHTTGERWRTGDDKAFLKQPRLTILLQQSNLHTHHSTTTAFLQRPLTHGPPSSMVVPHRMHYLFQANCNACGLGVTIVWQSRTIANTTATLLHPQDFSSLICLLTIAHLLAHRCWHEGGHNDPQPAKDAYKFDPQRQRILSRSCWLGRADTFLTLSRQLIGDGS